MEVAVKSQAENKKHSAFRRFSQNGVVDVAVMSLSAFAKDTRQLSAKVNLRTRRKQEQMVPAYISVASYSVYQNDYGISYGNYVEYGYGDA
jgi:hypothetical protein